MNVTMLSQILMSKEGFWIGQKENYFNHSDRSIIMFVIPSAIRRGMNEDEIRIKDLRNLEYTVLDGNVFLCEDFPPFQQQQKLLDIEIVTPVTCNKQEFLKQALNLDSNNFAVYEKLIEEINNNEK